MGPHAGAAGDVKASLRKDVLNVVGSAGPDTIVVRLQSVGSTMLVVDVGGDGTADYVFDRSKLTTVNVNGNGGDDTLIVDPVNGGFTDAERTRLDGGDGNDRLVGANFGETLAGGSGDDVLDGNGGMDLGTALTWDPGDSNDTVQAGGGIDRLVDWSWATSSTSGSINPTNQPPGRR